MNILLWIIFGAIAGWIASIIMNTDAQQGAFMNIVIGIVGAVAGGFLFQTFGAAGVSGFNLYSLLVAVVGSMALLGIVKMVRR